MTLILELEPKTEARLRALALERGEAPEKLAAARLRVSFLSDEEREDLEDELDLADMERARTWKMIQASGKRSMICAP